MKCKRMLTALLVLAVVLLLPGCGAQRYKDGVYTAMGAEFASSGWKEMVELTVEGGKIAKISWDAVYKDETIPIRKKQYSKSGLYGMLAAGASDEWYDQAVAAEQFVLKNGVDALNLTDDGHTDAVVGCTISVSDLDQLLRQCLEQAKR